MNEEPSHAPESSRSHDGLAAVAVVLLAATLIAILVSQIV